MGSSTGILMLIALMFLVTSAALQATTFCTSETNISTGQTLKLNLGNVGYTVVQNFITPNDAGVTVNGDSYTLNPIVPYTINKSTGSYVELAQINYIPIQPSVNLILCSAQQDADTQYDLNLSANQYGDAIFTHFGTRLIVSASLAVSQQFSSFPATVTIANVTGSTPSPPSGYVKLSALSINVSSSTSTMINMTQDVPCYVTPKTIAVYKLSGGLWNLISGFMLNSTSCKVTALIPSDPTVGIFYASSGSTASTTTQSTSSTSLPTSTLSSTTSSVPTTSIQQTTSTLNTTITTTKITSTTSGKTTSSTTTVPASGTTTQIPSYTTTISNFIQINASSNGSTIYQIPVDWIRDAILAAIALLVIYLIHLIIHRNPAPLQRKANNKQRK